MSGRTTLEGPRRRTFGSAHLGKTLRTVIVNPTEGFTYAFGTADRRERLGKGRPEGVYPYLLTAVGGASVMMLWLKLGGLTDARRVAPGDYGWGEIALALVVGATLALVALGWWWLVGPAVVRGLGGSTNPRVPRAGHARDRVQLGRDLCIVWGASAFPQMLAIVVLIPLDLTVVGPSIYATTRPEDSVSASWAALSFALSAAIAIWSLFVFVRGVQRATDFGLWRALAVAAVAAGCFLVVVAVASFLLLIAWRG